MDTKSFIEKSNTKHFGKYCYSKSIYKSSRIKITITCKEHGDFEQTPYNHIRGQGCPKCKTIDLSYKLSSTLEKFVIKANKIHNNIYEYSEYHKSSLKIPIKCKDHGIFYQTPNSHLRGRGCPKCGLLRNPKYNFDDFVERANKTHHSEYDYKQFKTCKASDKIIIICKKHGEFKQRVKSHLEGHGCGKCNLWDRLKFIEKSAEVHGSKYDYSLVSDSIKYSSKLSIICPKHGMFTQFLSNHVKGHGCPKCSIETMNHNKLNTSQFIERSIKTHGNKYDYSKSVYDNYYSNIIIICKKHGEFYQSPSNHIKGHGCLSCAASASSKPENMIFEFLRSNYDGEIIRNTKKIINPYELDLYLPDIRLAIEHHGSYFHSYNRKESDKEIYKNYHKKELCDKKGIKLLQFFEYEMKKFDIIKSIILYNIGKSNILCASEYEIVEIKSTDFFDDNHICGGKECLSKCYGLANNGEIFSAMLLSKHNENTWEITRFTDKLNVVVVGGADKIFKHFVSNYNPDLVLALSDRRFNDDELYISLGFYLDSVCEPGYKYWRKNIIINGVGRPDDNMFLNGYRRIWDAGYNKFIWSKQ